MISIVSGKNFRLEYGQKAKLDSVEFTLKNKGLTKLMSGDPFDEFYEVFLQLTFQSE